MCVRNLISRILSLIYSTNLRLDLEQLQIWQGVGGGRLVVSCQHRRHSCCLTKIDVDEFCCVAVNENILYVTVTQPDHVTNWREKKGRNISRTQLCVYAKLWGGDVLHLNLTKSCLKTIIFRFTLVRENSHINHLGKSNYYWLGRKYLKTTRSSDEG